MSNSLTIKNGDCRTVLKELASESVQCVVTSPPYWGLRDYGHVYQIGREETGEYEDNRFERQQALRGARWWMKQGRIHAKAAQ